MIKRTGLILACVLVLLMTTAIPILAIDDPDGPPEIRAVYVYQDLLEDGDCGILIDYFIDYTIAGISTEVVTESYLASFVDIDGATQLGTVAPYAFDTSGYGRGLVWIYFTAAEVVADGIDRANVALYEVWLMGNPTIPSGWPGVPPKTIAGIDYWQPADSDTSVLLALRVLYYADILELAWALDLVETTTLGSRLTTLGEAYFPNVINNLKTIAPAVFSVAEYTQIQEDLDYSTAFGATIEDGTGTLPVSPLTLVEGDNDVVITGAGTFLLELVEGTAGEAKTVIGGNAVTGTPAALVAGTNTITSTMAGTNNFTITVNLVDTQAAITDTITGTGLDLGVLYPGEVETLPEKFGMSTMMMSSLVWMGITILVCAAAYKGRSRVGFGGGGSSKMVLVVFDIMVIGGAILGLLDILVAVLLFIAFGVLTGYVLFYRSANF